MVRFGAGLFLACLFASTAEAALAPICKAAMDGDVPALVQNIAAGAPIDSCGTSYSPLMFAARYGRVEAVVSQLAKVVTELDAAFAEAVRGGYGEAALR